MQLPPNMPFEVMLQMIAGVAETDPEGAGTMLADLYDNEAGEYRPLLKAAAPILAAIGSDIGLVLATLVDGINGIGASPELQTSLETMRTQRAQVRKRILDSYEAAGFTRAEAMSLVMQDIANSKAAVAQLQQAASDGVKKPRTRPAEAARKAA